MQLGTANPIVEVLSGGRHDHRDLVVDIEPRRSCGCKHNNHHNRDVVIEDIRSGGRDYVVELDKSRRPCNKHRNVIVEDIRDIDIDLPSRRDSSEEVIIERKRTSSCNKKPDVFVHKLQPIVVNAKPRHIVVEAGKPQVIRTPPVFIHRKGQVHYESPRVVHHQSKPIFLTEKILKVQRPIHKKVFVEKFVREESAGHEEIVEKKLCQSSAHDIERSNGFVERLDLGERFSSGNARIENIEVDVDRNGSVELDVELDIKVPRHQCNGGLEIERDLVLS